MDVHRNFSIDFHGKYLHGGLRHFAWNSMENIRTPISMEFHGGISHGISLCHHLYFLNQVLGLSHKFYGRLAFSVVSWQLPISVLAVTLRTEVSLLQDV